MRRSVDCILTTHVGSLPYIGEPGDVFSAERRAAVESVVRRQRSIGLDVVNEGEYAKGGNWLAYLERRFNGFEEVAPDEGAPLIARGRDREAFAEFYAYAAERNALFFQPDAQFTRRRAVFACTGPVSYAGGADLAREIELLASVASGECFLTSTAPASIEVYRRNRYYKSEEDYLFAIADAIKVEYRAIIEAGFLLQVDDAWLPALWDRIGIDMGIDAFRKRCLLRVEALNHALSGLPEERIRYHLCWGSWRGPHAFDLELAQFVDVLLRVKAQAYLIEAANPRHAHEFEVWRETALPEGKILAPGFVGHDSDTVEHPRLVAQRICRFAAVVGRENVIAGADCGFGGRTHPQIAWAKLSALVEGARIASRELGYA